MPDISKCKNETCTLKELCYRYTSKPNEHWQSYGSFKQDEAGDCEYFWSNKEKAE